jgi:hypothetical protein
MKNLFLIVVFVLTLMVETLPQSFSTGKIGVTLSGAGRVRVFKDSTTGVRQIDRSSILVGTGPNAVFGYNQDAVNIEPVVTIQNPQLSDFEVYGACDNSFNNPPLPPHVLSKANVYGWLNGGYLVVKFRILNKEPNPMNAVIGMEIIPQVNGSYGLESMKWLASEKILSIFRTGEATHTGYKILSSGINTVTMIDWYDGYDTVDTDLWNWITAGTIDTAFDSGGDGSVNFFSQNAVNIPVGDSAYFWVGIAVGESEAQMTANMSLAMQKYNMLTSVEAENGNSPVNYVLEQNYPNPFNPETSIKFSIPQREFVSLKIYNSLGQEIASPVNKELETGSYTVKFNADQLTSGVYFYTVRAGNFVQTKKMVLVR